MKLRLDDIGRLTAGLKRIRPFLITADHRPVRLTDRLDLRLQLAPPQRQMSLF
jgi:predicted DNA-binding helix-hairpin-helix protein